MSLSDLFKPGWRHSNPAVRLRSVEKARAGKLTAIALMTLHEDAFQVAANRLASEEEVYDLLIRIKHLPIPSHLSLEIRKQRQQFLVGKISAPDKLEAIAFSFSPEVAFKALEKLSGFRILQVLLKTKSEAVQQAAFDRVQDQRDFVTIALDCIHPAIRMAAVAKLTDISVLIQAVFCASHLKNTWDLYRRLESLLEEAAAREDWEAIKPAAEKCQDLERKAKILLLLPGTEIDPGQLQVIARGELHYAHTYPLLQPIFKKMARDGWTLQDKAVEKSCPDCQGTGKIWRNIGSANENDVDGPYECGACNGKGRIRTLRISGQFKDKSFDFTALD